VSLPAKVYRVLTVGPLVKVELLNSQNQLIQVQIPHETYRMTPVKADQNVYLVPKASRVYGESTVDYAI
jgi:RPA family protein